jgi:hypothetical protein
MCMHLHGLYPEWPYMFAPRHQRKEMAQLWSAKRVSFIPGPSGSGLVLPDGGRIEQVKQNAIHLR